MFHLLMKKFAKLWSKIEYITRIENPMVNPCVSIFGFQLFTKTMWEWREFFFVSNECFRYTEFSFIPKLVIWCPKNPFWCRYFIIPRKLFVGWRFPESQGFVELYIKKEVISPTQTLILACFFACRWMNA